MELLSKEKELSLEEYDAQRDEIEAMEREKLKQTQKCFEEYEAAKKANEPDQRRR